MSASSVTVDPLERLQMKLLVTVGCGHFSSRELIHGSIMLRFQTTTANSPVAAICRPLRRKGPERGKAPQSSLHIVEVKSRYSMWYK